MLQMPLKPHSTETFLARLTCESEDICDNAVIEGCKAKPIVMLVTGPEILHGKMTFDTPTNLDPAGERHLGSVSGADARQTYEVTHLSNWGGGGAEITSPNLLLKPTPNLYESGGPLVFEAWIADTELTRQVIKAIHSSWDIGGKIAIDQDSRSCKDSETS